MMLRVRFLLLVTAALVNRSRQQRSRNNEEMVYEERELEEAPSRSRSQTRVAPESKEELESRKIYKEALDTKLTTEQFVDLLFSKTSVVEDFGERAEMKEDLIGKELLIASENQYIEKPEARRPGLPRPGLPRPGLPRPRLPRPGLPRPGLPRPGRPRPAPPKQKLHNGCKSVCPAYNGGRTFNCAKYLKDRRHRSWTTRRKLIIACFRCQRTCVTKVHFFT